MMRLCLTGSYLLRVRLSCRHNPKDQRARSRKSKPGEIHERKRAYMKFINLTDGVKTDRADLTQEYKSSHSYGVVAVGSENLFVKKGLKAYFISYRDADRIFRRVRRVNAMMCCENGELEIEYLVVGANGQELIEVQLPGQKAARMLMEELKNSVEGVEFSAP